MILKLLKELDFIIAFKFRYLKLLREYYFIKKNLYRSPETNIAIVKDRLFKILNYSIQNIPYYQKVAKNRNICPTQENVFDEIKKFPILTKSLIRNNWNDLYADIKKKNYILNTSGGTTGEPIKFIQGYNFLIKRLSANLVFNQIAYYNKGDKLIKLWGSIKDLGKNKNNNLITNFINKYIRRVYELNAFKMSDNLMKKYVREINRIRPKTILTYVQSIEQIAKFIDRNNLFIYSPKSIIVSAGVLKAEVKSDIEKIFRCKVFNRYGSREVGLIASSCRKSDKLHINQYHKFVEILDDDGIRVSENQRGNIIITDLTNYKMPLIRYKIGDRGSLNLSECSCGIGLLRLNNVYGRTVDLFKTSKGNIIDGEYFTHLFYFRRNIKKFQIIQEEIKDLKIKIVTLNKKKLSERIELEIKEKIYSVMGNDIRITFNYVKEIEPSKSGKFRYTISKV